MEVIRRHIWFSGRVQGVGFRYRAKYLAKALDLTGWVRNDWDGRVEMELQGSSEAIQQMLASLQEQDYIEIEHYEVTAMLPVKERKFQVRS